MTARKTAAVVLRSLFWMCIGVLCFILILGAYATWMGGVGPETFPFLALGFASFGFVSYCLMEIFIAKYLSEVTPKSGNHSGGSLQLTYSPVSDRIDTALRLLPISLLLLATLGVVASTVELIKSDQSDSSQYWDVGKLLFGAVLLGGFSILLLRPEMRGARLGILLSEEYFGFNHPQTRAPPRIRWRDIKNLELATTMGKRFLKVTIVSPESYGLPKRASWIARMIGGAEKQYIDLRFLDGTPDEIFEKAQHFWRAAKG